MRVYGGLMELFMGFTLWLCQNSYGIDGPFIDGLPNLKLVIFHSYVKLPEGMGKCWMVEEDFDSSTSFFFVMGIYLYLYRLHIYIYIYIYLYLHLCLYLCLHLCLYLYLSISISMSISIPSIYIYFYIYIYIYDMGNSGKTSNEMMDFPSMFD